MALDLHKVALQVDTMAASLNSSRSQRDLRLQSAMASLRQNSGRFVGPPDESSILVKRLRAAEAGRVTWLVGTPTGELAGHHPAPALPDDFNVVAADGSQIEVDRHGPAHCFLLNTGRVRIRYGSQPFASLVSQPRLYASEDELYISDPQGIKRQPVEGELLAAKRAVEECLALVETVEALDDDYPTLALLDGSLILWGLAGRGTPDFITDALITRGLLPALDRLRALTAKRSLALASYISRPRSTDVVNVLRLAECPHAELDTLGCDRICGRGGSGHKECSQVAEGVQDSDLFEHLLQPGERSDLFLTQSSVVSQHYGSHKIAFFYLNVGEELARVEIPVWVAEQPEALDFAHALLLSQCEKGRGYPVALAEAHEQAVVTFAAREHFWQLVERAMEHRRVPVAASEKSKAKQLKSL